MNWYYGSHKHREWKDSRLEEAAQERLAPHMQTPKGRPARLYGLLLVVAVIGRWLGIR